MTKGGVTTDALDAEPLSPISPPPDSHTNKNGNGNHSITNGQDIEDMVKVADPSQDDDAKSTSSEQDNERVREKLKKTSIANVRSDSSQAGEHGEKIDTPRSTAMSETDQDMSDDKEDETRRRRKRSFDETDGDGDGDGGGNKDHHSRHRVHERKRSREISEDDMARAAKALSRVKTPPTHPEEDEVMSQGEEASSTVASPRRLERKRGRGRLDEDDRDKEVGPGKKISRKEEEWQRAIEKSVPSANKNTANISVSTNELTNGKNTASVEFITMRPTEGELPSSSGFANTSAKSPFATAGAGTKPLFGPGTSTSDLFKNSKFGSLSSSSPSPFATASPFGALSQSRSTSPFGAGGLGGGSKTKPSGFGGGFGTYASGFGSLTSKVDVISSAPKLFKPIGNTTAKPFGAPDEEDKNSDDEDDEASDGDAEDNKREEVTAEDKKEAFIAQDVATGEENETTIFKCPGKIFFFDKDQKQWKERGRGTLKLNRTIPFAMAGSEDEEDLEAGGPKLKDSARLIMRTEGTYLVVLNVPIYKGMKLGGDIKGGVPTTNQLQFMTLENGRPVQMIIKCKSVVIAKELHKHVSDLQKELFT